MQLNGETVSLAERGVHTLTELVESYGIDPRLIAVQRNGIVVQRVAWSTTALSDDDAIEFIRFVGGG